MRLGPAWEAGDRHAVHGGYERWPPELGSPAPWAAGLSPGRSPIALGLRYLARLAAAQGVPRQHEARLGTPGNLPYIGDMAHSSATARLEARLPKSVHALLKRAAEIQGRTLTDFVVTAAHEAARQALMEAEIVRLSLADQERLAKALAKPPCTQACTPACLFTASRAAS